jgi:hypothetical protein
MAIFFSANTIIVAFVAVGSRRSARQHLRPALIGPVLSLTVIISVAATNWPLRTTYAFSRNAFDTIAERLRAGEPITSPIRAGLFSIEQAELSRDGVVCLWTELQPGGNTGFVQCRRDHVPFNLWSIVRLDDRWQFISED